MYQNYKNNLNKMNKKILLILSVVFLGNSALADSQSYGPIIQRQSKQIQELKARTSDLESSIGDLKAILKNAGLLTSKGRGGSLTPPKPVIINTVPGASILPDVDKPFFEGKPSGNRAKDKIDYDLALATLKDGSFEVAEKKFADFIKQYPASRLQSNATFWHAETYYRRGVYNKAAINYLQSYKKYPKGSKAPDALLKLSYSLASLNKNKEACSMLEKLELEFPKRSISSIKRAKEARARFRCK
jgi:tol-pal system protein YbgF